MHLITTCSCGEKLSLVLPVYEACRAKIFEEKGRECNAYDFNLNNDISLGELMNDLGYINICCRMHLLSYCPIQKIIVELYKVSKMKK
jgi:DNA-directed RNA polymerase subunit N (RpoN/RPB10)